MWPRRPTCRRTHGRTPRGSFGWRELSHGMHARTHALPQLSFSLTLSDIWAHFGGGRERGRGLSHCTGSMGISFTLKHNLILFLPGYVSFVEQMSSPTDVLVKSKIMLMCICPCMQYTRKPDGGLPDRLTSLRPVRIASVCGQHVLQQWRRKGLEERD